MVLLGRAPPELIANAVKTSLPPLRAPRHEDALNTFELAEALTYRTKLSRKVGVYEEDLQRMEPVLALDLDAASDPRGDREVVIWEL